MRQRCRTDLFLLCRVLGYKDVSETVHRPLLEGLQKFRGGTEEYSAGRWVYRPAIPFWQLEGCRQTLFLYPRGHLKTTVITIAHSIQWIINYPNIRILVSTAIGDQCDLIVSSIKKQFQYNDDFRTLFPEFCPSQAKAADFGSRDEFTVPNRTDHTLKEATVWSCSVGKVIAGFRADVIKNSDLVDEQNVKTPTGINEVISHFGHMEPLLERYNERDGFKASRGWNDVEGTRYDFGDLYGELLKASDYEDYRDKTRPIDWHVILRAAQDEKGKSLWPERFPPEELERIRRQPAVGDWIFSAQYLNKCIPQGDGLCDPNDVVFVPGHIIAQIMPRLRLIATIDLSGMQAAERSDFTCISVGGFDTDGRLYVVEIHCSRYSPEEVIDIVFSIHTRFKNLVCFRVEKEARATVLMPFLERESSKRSIYPRVLVLPRDSRISKQNRIRGLRPWFKNSLIRFNEAIPLRTKQELLTEITQFPSQSGGVHDDILDTLADLMQDPERESGVTADVIADAQKDPREQFGRPRQEDKFLGYEGEVSNWLYGSQGGFDQPSRKTGIL